MSKHISNPYTFLKRLENRLHGVHPFFHLTKRISRALKIRRYKKTIAKIQLPASPLERDPMFTQVEIETINRCNGNCNFCPVNHKQDSRPFKRMSEELFFKIINELASIQYDRSVYLYSNNEPFLDTRIYTFAEYAKSKLPSAKIVIYTNGTLLNVEKYKKIIGYLDELVIDNYCNDYKLNHNLIEVVEYIDSHPELWKKTSVDIRYENEILTTRGGQAPNASHIKPVKPINVGCRLPIRQMIIRPDGKLSLCCNDALGTVTVGDVSAESLVDVWNSAEAQTIRRNVLRSREHFEVCKACNSCK